MTIFYHGGMPFARAHVCSPQLRLQRLPETPVAIYREE